MPWVVPVRRLDVTISTGVDEAVIPILRVADASVAVAWYARLGFSRESEHCFGPGYASLCDRRARQRTPLSLRAHRRCAA